MFYSLPEKTSLTRNEGAQANSFVDKHPVQVEIQTESELIGSPFPSAKAESVKSSVHSICVQSQSRKLGARLHPQVGETHVLIPSLQSYSSLAPPKGREEWDDKKDRKPGIGKRSEEAEEEAMDVKKRGKLRVWMTDAKNANQNRKHMTMPPVRASWPPLPQTGSQTAPPISPAHGREQEGSAPGKEGSIRGIQKTKMLQPLKRLLDKASPDKNEREKKDRGKEVKERQKTENNRESEKRVKEKEKQDKEREKREKEREKREKEREKHEKEREKHEKEREKREKERVKREKEQEKRERERERRVKQKEKQEQKKEKEKVKLDGVRERIVERSVRSGSALVVVAVSRPLSRLVPSADPLAVASICCAAKALRSTLKRGRDASSSRIPAPVSSRTHSLPP